MNDKYIEDKTGAGFTSEQIFDYLLSLPKGYAARETNGKQPIFISFGFSYDIGPNCQRFTPMRKRWEVHNGKPFSECKNPDYRSSRNRPVLWKSYAIRCVAGKSIVLYQASQS